MGWMLPSNGTATSGSKMKTKYTLGVMFLLLGLVVFHPLIQRANCVPRVQVPHGARVLWTEYRGSTQRGLMQYGASAPPTVVARDLLRPDRDNLVQLPRRWHLGWGFFIGIGGRWTRYSGSARVYGPGIQPTSWGPPDQAPPGAPPLIRAHKLPRGMDAIQALGYVPKYGGFKPSGSNRGIRLVEVDDLLDFAGQTLGDLRLVEEYRGRLAQEVRRVRKVRRTMAGQGPDSVKDLLADLKRSNPGARWSAAVALGDAGAGAVPELSPLLWERDVDLLRAVAFSLGRIGPRAAAAVPGLSALLEHEGCPVRLAAVRALGQIRAGDQAAMAGLLKALDHHGCGARMGDLRLEAIQALERIGTPARLARPSLERLAAGGGSATSRAATRALARMGAVPTGSIPTLLTALEGGGGDQARKEAARTLGMMGAAPVPDLVRLLGHRGYWVRQAAALALEGIGPQASAAVPALVKLVPPGERASIRYNERIQVLRALGAIGAGASEAVPALFELVTEEDTGSTLLTAAAQALLDIGVEQEGVVASLLEVVGRGRTEAGILVTRSLESLGPSREGIIPALVASLDKALPRGKVVACKVLGNIGPRTPAVVPALAGLLTTGGEPLPVREAAAQALARMGLEAAEAVPALIKAIGTDVTENPAAARALGNIGPAAAPAVPALAAALKHGNRFLCFEAARALGKIGPPARPAIPALKTAREKWKVSIYRGDKVYPFDREVDQALARIAGASAQ